MIFSDPTNKLGMYELYQDLTKTNPTSYTAYKYARDANNAYADYFMLAIGASGKWQVDDTNHSDYPEMKIDVVTGQFDYPFTTDGSATPNQVLDIERVELTLPSGQTIKLEPYDEMEGDESIVQDRTVTGIPSRYSKRANGLFLDCTPNFDLAEGLRVFFARTPSYFLGTDTTKKAGIPDAHHEYLVYRPAYLYCITNLPALANGYLAIVNGLETKIKDYYARRNRDEHRKITNKPICHI